jgi:transcriptional regulator with XRE-family HTH domain
MNKIKTPIRIAFGKRLRKRRKELKLSLEAVAKLCNIHYTYIGSAERGERNIGLENIVKLATVLQCRPSYFFKEII